MSGTGLVLGGLLTSVLCNVVTRTVLPVLSQIRVALRIMKSPFMAMMLCFDDIEDAVPGDSNTVRGSDQIQVHTDFYQKKWWFVESQFYYYF